MKKLLLLALFVSPSAFSEILDDATVKCAVNVADQDDAEVVLTSGAELFSIKLLSRISKPLEVVYEKSDISLLVRPIEAPALECIQEGISVTLWEQSSFDDGKYFAEVNGRYFELANGTPVD